MTQDEHRARHRQLYGALCELIADYLLHNPGARPEDTDLVEFGDWARDEVREPTFGFPHLPVKCGKCGATVPDATAHVCEVARV